MGYNNSLESNINSDTYKYMNNSIPNNSVLSKTRVIISVNELTKEYKIGKNIVHALNNISLDVYDGEFLTIAGASGSGKSTLLQLLGGLDKPTNGNITIDGVNIKDLSDRKLSSFRSKTIGFVFQFFYLQPFLRLSDNIELPGMFTRLKRNKRKEKAQRLAQLVGLSDRIQHFPNELSGGQIQRAAIIRALMNQPKIILADEPTGNLDSQNSAAIIDLFKKVRQQFGTTIIVATHDPSIAAQADRTITIKDGEII